MKKWLFKDTQCGHTHIQEGETAQEAALNMLTQNGVVVTEVQEEPKKQE